MKELLIIFFATVTTNNVVWHYFLGICPFLGVSNKLETAIGMGFAVTFVMTLATIFVWPIYHLVLLTFGLEFLEYVSFILVIASLVQFVEMYLRKMVPTLYRALGIFLPLITTNCAILGVTLFMVIRDYNFIQSVVFAFSAGIGFTLALLIMAGIRENLELAPVPESLKGAGVTLIIAGILALAFMGLVGLVG
ncbi:MAG TPA: RnfABCDGE type electron transport complex subunit A [Candidatus Omnitrophica bacterium]|nr:RnfABCDGE type electron transport complex subunit A [Candidatus Omnitrophota bacterium]